MVGDAPKRTSWNYIVSLQGEYGGQVIQNMKLLIFIL